MALAESNDIELDSTKYTSQVHHACLVLPPSPSPSPPVDPKNLPPVPVIYYTAEMEHARMSTQHLRAYRYWHLGKRDIDNMCTELSLKSSDGLKRGTVMFVATIKIYRPRSS